MDIDKTTCITTLWMAGLGAVDLFAQLPHPVGVATALLAAAPLALRLAVLASQPPAPGRVSALDAEALALGQFTSDARPGGRDSGDARRRKDWQPAMP